MSLAMALVLVAPPALRWAAAAVGSAYAIGVGVAVVLLDWHRPSDVLGAYLVTVAWTAPVAAVLAGRAEAGGLAVTRRAAPGRRAGRRRPDRGARSGLRARRGRRRRPAGSTCCGWSTTAPPSPRPPSSARAACALLGAVVTALIQRGASSPYRARAR